ncbi:MAG: hypothetical protein H6710_09655 [Myxococcales bacterium]|nr:hypothetical protein [Myxococcales bacterium]MCB9700671.1 hypothetical protein [Myxococcales bacterium]
MNGPIGERNLWVEVSDATFCEPVQLTFLRAGEPQRVAAVDIDGDGPRAVLALERTASGELRSGPAWACLIEESGSGMAWLVYGGDAGLVVLAEGARVDEELADLAALADAGHDFDAYFIVERDALELAPG